ncbi:putative prefoldin subunit alpha [Candidatus Nitrososphaera gargensis Ga9.2]|uniref:Prefoldin subunit alpha n=1 Tax=Nitrososphaera gargensis (strain Ga9.2) TaxID=1237085 RepID=K0ID92_NITGG|nr:putative prefoldin subunit alpha [Candidatus Nitrososphaera gargensis Ga9.2]
MAAVEQRINEMVQQSRILEAYMNDIMTRQVTVSRLMEEARLASTTIQNITSESEIESLMPVGVGVYVKTTVPPIKKVVVNLGAGVALEKSREDALNYVESRIKEYEVAARQLDAQRQEIAMRMEQMQAQINQMIRAAQQQQPG